MKHESKRWTDLLYEPKSALQVAILRITLFGFFIFKLLSRDFSIFGFAPSSILNVYPNTQYSFESGISFLGFPFLVDIMTFHWIHWFVPLPEESALFAIQFVAIVFCALVIVFGRGHRNFLAIGTYLLLTYLWGYCWRSGAKVDAVFLHLQILLIYCFYREPEALILGQATPALTRTQGNGWFFSMVVLIFCGYYFQSGLSKIVDITPTDWFSYNFITLMNDGLVRQELGYFGSVNPYLGFLNLFPSAYLIAVPIAYMIELMAPLAFFKRRLLPLFLLNFIIFHYMVWAVGIWFMGNIVLLTGILVSLVVDHLVTRAKRPNPGLSSTTRITN